LRFSTCSISFRFSCTNITRRREREKVKPLSGPVLDRVVDDALIPVASEESLMQQHDFPGSWPTESTRKSFGGDAARLLEPQKAGKPAVPVSLPYMRESG